MLLLRKGNYESHWNEEHGEVVMFLKRDEPTSCDISGLPVEDHVVSVILETMVVTGEDEDKNALQTFHCDGKDLGVDNDPHGGGMTTDSFLWYIARQDKGYYDRFHDTPQFSTTHWKVHCDKHGEYARTFFCLDIAQAYTIEPTCGGIGKTCLERKRIHRVDTVHNQWPELSSMVSDKVYSSVFYSNGETIEYTVQKGDTVIVNDLHRAEVIEVIEDGMVSRMELRHLDGDKHHFTAGVLADNIKHLDGSRIANKLTLPKEANLE